MPQLAFPIIALFDQPVETQVELWENKVKVYSKRVYLLQKIFLKTPRVDSWTKIKSGCEIRSDHVKYYSVETEHSWF